MKESRLWIQEACKKRFSIALSAIEAYIQTIDKNVENSHKPLLIGIDGMCGSGKTTLGYYIQQQLGGNLFHMDDFFLQNNQRTKKRMEEIGGNVDYERFSDEVLKPILQQEAVFYRPFDCAVREIKEGRSIPYQRLNVIEGSYSLHPYFGDVFDVKIFMTIKYNKQLEIIRLRNGEDMLKRFVSEWIPKENAYFETFQIARNCIRIPWDDR